jgi:hypothetical protein
METNDTPCIRCVSSSDFDRDRYDVEINVERLMEDGTDYHDHPFTWIRELLDEDYFDASYGSWGSQYRCEYFPLDEAEILRQAKAWYEANPETVEREQLTALDW